VNRQELIEVATKAAFESARKLDEKYTCPSCRSKLYDPDKGWCKDCGFKAQKVCITPHCTLD
jgi:predicted amidophosphoribosyltransferase